MLYDISDTEILAAQQNLPRYKKIRTRLGSRKDNSDAETLDAKQDLPRYKIRMRLGSRKDKGKTIYLPARGPVPPLSVRLERVDREIKSLTWLLSQFKEGEIKASSLLQDAIADHLLQIGEVFYRLQKEHPDEQWLDKLTPFVEMRHMAAHPETYDRFYGTSGQIKPKEAWIQWILACVKKDGPFFRTAEVWQKYRHAEFKELAYAI